MIFVDRTITIRNGVSKINEAIILYRCDYDVTIRFTLMTSNLSFKSGYNMIEYVNASNAQLAILKPNGEQIFSEVSRCNEGVVEFIFNKELMNDIHEVGDYSFHIRLFDYSQQSRITIPEVVGGIVVREPLVTEDRDNSVEEAIVGYAVLSSEGEEEEPLVEDNGSYEKTVWKPGDKITTNKLNRIENALANIYNLLQSSYDTLNKQQSSNYEILMNEIENLKNNE